MPPKRRTPARRGKATQELSLSTSTTMDELMGLSVPVLREHLKKRNLSHTGNKGTLAQALLDHLQGQANGDEETSTNDPTEEDNHPFTAAQQAALRRVVQSALANASKTTSPST